MAASTEASSRLVHSLLLTAVLMTSAQVAAQNVRRGTSALNLPRPGYEPHRIRVGRIEISPEILAAGQYDSNVYATPVNEDDDFVYDALARIDAVASSSNFSLQSDAYINYRGHAENTSENSTTYGFGGTADYTIHRMLSTSGGARFDRAVQSRNDPEASQRLKAVDIDSLTGNFAFSFSPNRLGLSGRAEFQNTNYLPASEHDRDYSSYRGSLGLSLLASSRFDLFVEGFANRRDHATGVDRSGIDRDTTTLGLLAGTSIDIANKWQGRIGVGAFRANPDDPALRSFSGFSTDASLTWRPDERTSLAASVFRGDVATVRAGASGRIDTSASLRWDQEVRHNLLLRIGGGFRETSYRGGGERKLRQASVDGELEYLVNNRLSVMVNAGYARRTASVAADRFKRAVVGLGLRLRY